MGSYVYAPHGPTYSNVYPGQKVGHAKPVKGGYPDADSKVTKAPPAKKALIPATEKQVKFIRSLMSERVIDGSMVHDLKVSIDAGTLTKDSATEKIGLMLASPKRDKSGDHKVVSQPKVAMTKGYYVDESTQTFFEAVQSKAGKFYAKRFEVSGKSGKWVYAPGAINHYATWKKISLTDAAQFGIAHGVCLCCGRTLTAPESVAAGIGPICAQKF